MSGALLHDYELKRERAVAHLDALRTSIRGRTAAKQAAAPGEYDPEYRRYLFYPELLAADAGWAVLLGDAVYNARAALDYLVTALVRTKGAVEDHCTEFPIYGINPRRDSPKHWTKIDDWWEKDPRGEIKRKLAGTPAATKDALKRLQPFYGAPRTNPALHPLSQLQQLSNRDKHRRLNLLARAAEIQFVDRSGAPFYPGPAHRVRVPEPSGTDDYTISLTVSEDSPRETFLVATTAIHLDEPPELTGEAIETLEAILGYLDASVAPTVRQLL
jgi:hypothetical protein